MPESRILKYNEDNLKKQKDLESTASTQKNKQKAESAKRPNDSTTDRAKKRTRESTLERVHFGDFGGSVAKTYHSNSLEPRRRKSTFGDQRSKSPSHIPLRS